jgi:hypothetical protein
MRTISTRIHGILDYLLAGFLLAAPWICDFSGDRHAQLIALALGGLLLLMSALTEYEAGLLRLVPFPFHRFGDLLLGLLLAFSPIHFGISGTPAIVFIIVGFFEIVLAAVTRPLKKPEKVGLAPGVKSI